MQNIFKSKISSCEYALCEEFSCSEMFNCCNCGDVDYGCRGCFACNACDYCKNDD